MKELPRPCPACGSERRQEIGSKNGFDICRCRVCSTLYTGRVPEVHESENYDDYYGEANLNVPEFVRGRVAEIVGGFQKFRRTNKLLDIGFGAGTLLEVAQRLGWEVSGLEVSRPAVEHAAKRGFDVFHGSLGEADYPDGSFDVVTASEILEHLPDPVGDLKEIARILRPGGLLWATTPSATSLSYRLLGTSWTVLSPPEHIQLYSKKGAAIIIRHAGFAAVDFRTYGLNPAEIVSHYRRRPRDEASFDRVNAAYSLNQSLTSSPLRRTVKSVINGTLDLFAIGDSLKIYARTR